MHSVMCTFKVQVMVTLYSYVIRIINTVGPFNHLRVLANTYIGHHVMNILAF